MADDTTNQGRRRDFLKISGMVAASSVGLSGCTGSGDTSGDGSSGDGSSGDGNGGTTAQKKSLVEKAQEEGEVKIASPLSSNEVFAFNGMFEDEFGITVNYQEGDSKPSATKVLQEYQAGKQSFDLISMSNVTYHVPLADEGAYRKRPESLADLETDWYYDNMIPVQMFEMDLGWLYNQEIVNTLPKTWSELASGDYRVTLDTEEPELIVVFENMYGLEEAKKMVRDLGKVAILQDSHTTAGKSIAQGNNDMGILKYYHMYDTWGRDLAPLHHENAMTHKGKIIPVIAIPNYMPLCADSPHPNAGALYLKYAVNNLGDVINEGLRETLGGEIPYAPRAIPTSYPKEHEGVRPLAFDDAPKLNEYFDLYQQLVGIGGG